MIFSNMQTDFNFIFGQFSVARKLILNGGAIRPLVTPIFSQNVAFCRHGSRGGGGGQGCLAPPPFSESD